MVSTHIQRTSPAYSTLAHKRPSLRPLALRDYQLSFLKSPHIQHPKLHNLPAKRYFSLPQLPIANLRGSGSGDAAQWYNVYLACANTWVQSPLTSARTHTHTHTPSIHTDSMFSLNPAKPRVNSEHFLVNRNSNSWNSAAHRVSPPT